MSSVHTLVTPEELRAHALQFLKSEHVMVLGTSSGDKVWSATVDYVATDEFELIFYSRTDTRHGQNILENKNVSAVITEMPSKKTGNLSIQLAGEARVADGIEWNVYFPLYEKKAKNAKKDADHIIYVVRPTELWMIHEKLLGHYNRTKVL